MKIKNLTGISIASAMTVLGSSAFADCGDITMAEMNWPSAQLMANVDKIILEAGYGCSVEMIVGATTTTFASMDAKGSPNIAPELWVNAVREPLDVALAEGRLHSALNGAITDAGEGWWIPPYTAEKHPELKTVLDILDHPELFPDKEDPSKGAFIGCPAGWGCQLSNINLFRAFEMEKKGWVLVDPGTQAGLDGSLVKANNRNENWFGYYWAPTAMIGKYGMKLVPFGVPFAGAENWDGCIAKAEQDCADPKPSAWTSSEVHTVVTDSFKNKAGNMMDYFAKRIVNGSVMGSMLVFMDEEQADGPDAAAEFMSRHEDVWMQWIPADVAAKVKAAL